MDNIKDLISDFVENMGPVFDDWDDESQGMTIEEKFWVLSALIFFRSYTEGSTMMVDTPVPTYEDKKPSPIMHTLKKQMRNISVAIVHHAEQRENETKIKNLQEQLAQRDSQIKDLQDQLTSKDTRVKKLKGAIIELRDQIVSGAEDESFVHVGSTNEPINEMGLFYRLFKKSS